ncbi:MAG TPA: hypothetical protein DDZ99_06150 [Clostridiales bacterium]|nr:hypothetical protein [Clostridiales bacterium]
MKNKFIFYILLTSLIIVFSACIDNNDINQKDNSSEIVDETYSESLQSQNESYEISKIETSDISSTSEAEQSTDVSTETVNSSPNLDESGTNSDEEDELTESERQELLDLIDELIDELKED